MIGADRLNIDVIFLIATNRLHERKLSAMLSKLQVLPTETR